MLLELKADRQLRFKDPAGQFGGINQSERRAKENRTTFVEPPLADDRDRPVEIRPMADDHLDLVARFEPIEVGPQVGRDFRRTPVS